MKDGFYWVRNRYDNEAPRIAEVVNGRLYYTGREDSYDVTTYEMSGEFISKEPLTPPEAP